MELDPVIDEQTLKELENLPEVSVEDLRVGSFAYKVGILALKREYPLIIYEEGAERG